MSKILEKTIESYFKKKAKSAGGLSFKWSSPSHRGVPDQILFINREVWFIEMKRPGGKLTALQEHVGKQILSYGQNYCVLSSKDDVDKFIEARKQND